MICDRYIRVYALCLRCSCAHYIHTALVAYLVQPRAYKKAPKIYSSRALVSFTIDKY